MARFVVRRLLQCIPVWLGVVVAVFLMVHLVPGDPVRAITGGRPMSAETARSMRHELGLDLPLSTQLVRYLGRLARADLGRSLVSHRAVSDEIMDRLPSTLALALAGLGLGIPLGLALGVLGAAGFRSLLMPATVLGLGVAAPVLRLAREGMLDVLRSDYVRTARAKGLAPFRVIAKHALRNAINPVVTYAGLAFGYLLGGAFVLEQVFSRPGLGRLTSEREHIDALAEVQRIFARDAVFATIGYPMNALAVRRTVRGVRLHPLSLWPILDDAWIADE